MPPSTAHNHRQRLSPAQAIERLEALYVDAIDDERRALARFVNTGVPPAPEERARFRYPELKLSWHPSGKLPVTRRAWGRLQEPGAYATTVTQPVAFRQYLMEQLRPLTEEYGAQFNVGVSEQEVPYPYVLDHPDELALGDVSAAELARYFPAPMLASVGPL